MKSILHLAYPTRCLHCRSPLPPEPLVLCSPCAELLELIPPEERCPTCFNPSLASSDVSHSRPCRTCMQYPPNSLHNAAAFDYAGPAATLVKNLRYADQPYLALGMGAWLIAQWSKLKWPIPDALIPVPASLSDRISRGYNPNALLAESMGQFLQRPVWHALKRNAKDYKRETIPLEPQREPDDPCFRLHPKFDLEGKILLIIEDLQEAASQECAAILHQARPAACYSLAFCREDNKFTPLLSAVLVPNHKSF